MRFLFAAVALAAVSGCATIVKSSTQDLQIQSTPAGANIQVTDANGNSVFQGATPSTVTLKRGAGYFEGARYSVTVSKTGYQSQTFNLEPHTNGWYIGGNILLGGLIGWLAVDPASGAMWTLSPEAINTSLGAADVSESAVEAHSIALMLAEDVPLEMWKDMVRVQ